MDGMLMEWEKMLEDSAGLDDIEQADIMNSELSLLGGKNESSSNKDGETLNGTSGQDSFSQLRSPSSLAEDSAETLKLIAELNSDKTDNFDLPKFSSQGQIAEKMTDDCDKNISDRNQPSDEHKSEKSEGESSSEGRSLLETKSSIEVKSLTETKSTLDRSPLSEDESNHINAISCKSTENGNDIPMMASFENCEDSQLQISEVRSGDIPKALDVGKESIKENVDIPRESDVGNDSIKENGTLSETSTHGPTPSEVETSVKDNKLEDEDKINEIKISDVRTDTSSPIASKKITEEREESMPVVENNGDNAPCADGGDDEMENSMYLRGLNTEDFVTMQIKEEPMDYEEYSKPEEFVTNFYDEFEGQTQKSVKKLKTKFKSKMVKWTEKPEVEFTVSDAGLYQCVYCSARFPSHKDFKKHCIIRHKDLYRCKYCGEQFYRSQEMAFHYRYGHPQNSREKLQKKIDRINVQQKLNNNGDEIESTSSKKPLKKKKSSRTFDADGNPVYKCAYCPRKFPVQQAMASHVRNHHILRTTSGDMKVIKKKGTIFHTNKKKFVHGKIVEKLISSETSNGSKADDDPNTEEKNDKEGSVEKQLHYKNMSFESDTSQTEEAIALTDCSLKRELKSSLVYHCSKCPKWFYRKKQVAKHEQTCTGDKQEPVEIKEDEELDDEKPQFEKLDGTSANMDFHSTNDQASQIKCQSKKDVERKIQSEISKKLRQKMLQKISKPPVLVNKTDGRYMPSTDNYLLKYFCKYCPTSFEAKKDMNLHFLKHLGDVRKKGDSLICRACKQSFKKRSAILEHLQEHASFNVQSLFEQRQLRECKYCGMPFLCADLWINHVKVHKKQEDREKMLNKHLKDTDVAMEAASSFGKHSDMDNNKTIIDKTLSDASLDSDSKQDKKPVLQQIPNSDSGRKQDKLPVLQQILNANSSKNLILDDIPFQCGMCFARFPNSQFLLHHITLHMQGPFVFKSPSEEKTKTLGTPPDKKITISTGSPLRYSETNSVRMQTGPIMSMVASNDLGQLKSVIPKSQSLLNAPKIINVPIMVKNTESVKVLVEDKGSVKTIDVRDEVMKISMDHHYTSAAQKTVQSSTVGNSTGQKLCTPVVSNPTEKLFINTSSQQLYTPTVANPTIRTMLMPSVGKAPSLNLSTKPVAKSNTHILILPRTSAPLVHTGTPKSQNMSLLSNNTGISKSKIVIVPKKLQPSIAPNILSHNTRSILPFQSSGIQVQSSTLPMQGQNYQSLVTPTLTQGQAMNNQQTGVIQNITNLSWNNYMQNVQGQGQSLLGGQYLLGQSAESASKNLSEILRQGLENNSDNKLTENEKLKTSIKVMNNNSTMDNESVSSEEESLADYDSEDCEELERDANGIKNQEKPMKISSESSRENVESHRRSSTTHAHLLNFKKCVDIASGQWFECSFCLYLCSSAQDLENHMKNHESPGAMKKAITCHICNQTLLSKWHLNRHMSAHTNESYKCSFCEARFSTSEDILNHISRPCKI